MNHIHNLLYIFLLCPIPVMSQYNLSVDKIPSELIQDAAAVVRNETISIDIKSRSSYTYSIDETVTILNKSGDYPLTVYYSKSSKIKFLEAFIYDKDGQEIKKLKKKHFNDYSATGSNEFHDDNRVYAYEHPTNDYPYTMRIIYSIETPNTVFLPRWQPISRYGLSVEKSIYHITCPSNLDMRMQESNFDECKIEKSETANGHSFKLENAPAKKAEPMSPSLQSFTPILNVAVDHFHLEGVDGSAEDWSEFGRWYYHNLLKDQHTLSDETVAEVKLLTQDISDPIEKAKTIYEFVQNRSRYISVQLGIGGWKPTSADEVHRLGYGDCKGLTNYTHALLAAVGIESFYCPVYAGDQLLNVKSDFHGMQGNHVILCVPDPETKDSIWVECTSQDAPFGYIGDFTDDRDLLVISPDGGRIQHTTIYDESNSQRNVQGEIQINAEGDLTLSLDRSSSGIYYDRQGIQTLKGKDLEKIYIDEYNHLGSITINKYKFDNQKSNQQFIEHLELSCNGFAQNMGNDMVFTPNLFPNRISAPDKARNRQTPFIIKRSASFHDSLIINIPDGMNIQHIPEKVTQENQFGKYEMNVSKKDESTLLFTREFIIQKGEYANNEYDEYRNFIKKISKLDRQKIILTKS